ncbi:MAG: fasciclin domain-containing protein [Phycisphaerae bacterium]
MLDLYNTTWQVGCCKTFLAAVRASGLTPVVRSVRSVTLLAPTDDAFSLLPAGYVNHLLSPENDSRLRDLVAMHLIASIWSAEQLADHDRIQTVLGPWLDINSGHGVLRVESAEVFQSDIPATNGVLHIIDRVLLPASLRADCRPSAPARAVAKTHPHCAAIDRRSQLGPRLMTDWVGDQPGRTDRTQ